MVAGTQIVRTIMSVTDSPTLANRQGNETGSKVHGLFLSLEVVATSSAALTNVYMFIMKNPGGNLTAPTANIIGADDNKRYVIHQEMVMLQEQTGSNPRTLFKGVIKIPRGYTRQGPNDLLQLGLLAPGISVNYCFQAHWKEFR